MLEPGKPPPAKKPRKERNRRKATAITQSPNHEDMEQEIWREFPEDLYEAVVARLPIATFFRFRSVCRKWNALLGSQSFSEQCLLVKKQAHPWFFTITPNENMCMYDPSSKKWHHPMLLPLPAKPIVFPVASNGGLICFLDIGYRRFYVCNPLTRSFRELPVQSVKVWSRVAFGMTKLSGSSGYKVLWVNTDGDFQVYDSTNNSCTHPVSSVPSNIKIPLAINFRSQTVSIEGTIHFMRSDPDGLVSYDTNTGMWRQSSIPMPPRTSDQVLAECGGRIMLVDLLTKNAATCVCIWELQRMTLLWKEVDRMPNILCLEFYGKHVRMTCLGNKGLIMLSLRSSKVNCLVTYDPLSGEWLKAPDCTLKCGRKKQWVACGIAFDPCLTASA